MANLICGGKLDLTPEPREAILVCLRAIHFQKISHEIKPQTLLEIARIAQKYHISSGIEPHASHWLQAKLEKIRALLDNQNLSDSPESINIIINWTFIVSTLTPTNGHALCLQNKLAAVIDCPLEQRNNLLPQDLAGRFQSEGATTRLLQHASLIRSQGGD